MLNQIIYLIETEHGTVLPNSLEEARQFVSRNSVKRIFKWIETQWIEIQSLPIL